jgi:hypothetical protein
MFWKKKGKVFESANVPSPSPPFIVWNQQVCPLFRFRVKWGVGLSRRALLCRSRNHFRTRTRDGWLANWLVGYLSMLYLFQRSFRVAWCEWNDFVKWTGKYTRWRFLSQKAIPARALTRRPTPSSTFHLDKLYVITGQVCYRQRDLLAVCIFISETFVGFWFIQRKTGRW